MSPSYHFPSAFETAQSRQEYIYRPITFSSESEIGPATCDGMGILTDSQNKRSPSSSSTSPCANLRAAYHNCFSRSSLIFFMCSFSMFFADKSSPLFPLNPSSTLIYFSIPSIHFWFFWKGFYIVCRWYSEKFVKGQWDKEECVSEWQKYKACLSVSFR